MTIQTKDSINAFSASQTLCIKMTFVGISSKRGLDICFLAVASKTLNIRVKAVLLHKELIKVVLKVDFFTGL